MADFYKIFGESCAHSAIDDVRAVDAACDSVKDLSEDIDLKAFRSNEALSRAVSTRAYNAVKIYHEALSAHLLKAGIELPDFDSLISEHFDG